MGDIVIGYNLTVKLVVIIVTITQAKYPESEL